MKKSLILDLDETLVHSSTCRGISNLRVSPVSVSGKEYIFYVICRPHLQQFLKEASKLYDIYIFTASVKAYADPLINLIDPDNLVKGRYFRESCIEHKNGIYIKDLSKKSLNFDLSKTIIIDNSPISYSNNEENALPISSFIDNQSDSALAELLPLLELLYGLDDVRSILSLRTSLT
uniref:FCP1 homology domain-containing protein n=1 Tax=Arcella intermedia TaxID=1963864 RepID=A0A6B2LKT3_9EUKA